MGEKIRAKIIEKESRIIEFTKSLIKIPTRNPPGENYSKIIKIIKRELGNEKLVFRIYKSNGKPNLVVLWDTGSKKTLGINGHIDTVPVTPNWKHKPFEPVVEDGKLFGRGAQDMKSSLASMVYAIKILKELKIKPVCNVELSFTCDEESGGVDGLGYLVKNNLSKADFAITLDGPNTEINNAHKGILVLEIMVVGKSSHAAWPHNGINAFTGACNLAVELEKLNQELSRTESKCDTKEKIEKHPTIVLGGLTSGGSKFNVIPGEFSFTVDRRIIPEEDIIDVKKQIMRVIDDFKVKNREYTVQIKTLLEAKPAYVSKNSTISKVLFNNITKVIGKTPSFFLLPGFLDMRFFVNEAKIDCVNYGVEGGNLHGDDEFVYTKTICDNVCVLINLLLDNELIE
ncbi:MAG: ArgE/DapE family deacylase [Candidatus Micrarchaeia archaeon]